MYGGRGFARGPYSHSVPFKTGEMGFRSPMPRYQSSPRLPQHNGNGNGSTPPHQGQGRYPSPNHHPNVKSPPHFMQSPPHFMQSPPHFMQSPPHYIQSPPHGTDFSSKSPLHKFDYSRSPRGSPRGRGSFPSGGGRGRGSPRYHQNPSPRQDSDCNPGGSCDIGLYYNHNMVEDPWKNLAPVPVSKAAIAT